jgi:hypothetical protein
MGSLDPNAKKLDPYSIILSSTVDAIGVLALKYR